MCLICNVFGGFVKYIGEVVVGDNSFGLSGFKRELVFVFGVRVYRVFVEEVMLKLCNFVVEGCLCSRYF